MNNTIDLYRITNLTSLHAGRGDSNYGIVDNEVQRDPIQNLPVIFSSSLKGSLRELFERHLGKGHPDTIKIFGNEVKNSKTIQPGSHIFHEARLLTLPVRSEQRPFYYATTPDILQDLADMIQVLQPDATALIESLSGEALSTVKAGNPLAEESGYVDEFYAGGFGSAIKPQLKAAIAKKLLQSPLAVFHTEDFKSICERLPVIARNQLENGVSKNLFYEEVVPRQTQFTFFLERPEGDDTLFKKLQDWKMRVQIGANASIGYGVCQLERISLT